VECDGVDADIHAVGDLPVAEPLRDELRDIEVFSVSMSRAFVA
jgi:hypothetical protein